MVKIILPSLSFLIAALALAQDTRLAVIKRIEGSDALPPGLARQLERSTLHIVSRKPGLELLLSGANAPLQSEVDAVAVESTVTNGTAGYRVEARLIDLKTKKLIGKAAVDRIREEDVLRMFEGALERIFEPFEKTLREKSPPTPAPKKPETPPVTLQQRALPSTVQTNTPNASAVDFRERVRALKVAVDKEIVRTAEAKAEEERKRTETEKKESAAAAAALGVAGISRTDLKPDPAKGGVFRYPQRHRLSLGYNTREINSNYFVDSTATASFLNLRAEGHVPLLFKGLVGGSYDLAVNRSMAVPVELPTLWHAGAFLSYTGVDLVAGAGLLRDTNFFMNLPGPGLGIQPKTIVTTWALARVEANLYVGGRWKLEGSYGVPAAVETNYGPLMEATAWSGSVGRAAVTPPLSYLNFVANFAVERIALTTQGERPFTLTDSRFAFSVQRSL
jgi:hypothetical protein